MEINYLDQSRSGWLGKQPKRVSSATLILENEAGEALIVKARYKNYWTFPGGIIDAGETPKEAALRETLEEVGIDVRPESVEFVAVVNRRSSVAHTFQFIFKAPLESSSVDHVSLQVSEIEASALVTREQVVSGDRKYGKVLHYWTDESTGYIEQVLDGEPDTQTAPRS